MPRESKGDRRSQRQRILDVLVRARGSEVSAVALSKISLQYSARVRELRAAGFRIANRIETRGRTKHGFFRLELGAPTPTIQEHASTEPIGSIEGKSSDVCTESGRLFTDMDVVNATFDARFYPD